jgi:hypothetical protein
MRPRPMTRAMLADIPSKSLPCKAFAQAQARIAADLRSAAFCTDPANGEMRNRE